MIFQRRLPPNAIGNPKYAVERKLFRLSSIACELLANAILLVPNTRNCHCESSFRSDILFEDLKKHNGSENIETTQFMVQERNIVTDMRLGFRLNHWACR